uniref:Apple domain-containing protein n=1 Tax=Romanomermis culicivorax TaxID=13658 RepID=A0A915J1D2_ROMCU
MEGCTSLQVAFRKKSVALPSNFGNFLNSTSFSEMDCAVKCMQKVVGCEAVRFDSKNKLCMYGKYSPDVCPIKGASPRVEKDDAAVEEPGKITLMYCIQCLGSDQASFGAERVPPSPLFETPISIDHIPVQQASPTVVVDPARSVIPLGRNSIPDPDQMDANRPDLATFLQRELKLSKNSANRLEVLKPDNSQNTLTGEKVVKISQEFFGVNNFTFNINESSVTDDYENETDPFEGSGANQTGSLGLLEIFEKSGPPVPIANAADKIPLEYRPSPFPTLVPGSPTTGKPAAKLKLIPDSDSDNTNQTNLEFNEAPLASTLLLDNNGTKVEPPALDFKPLNNASVINNVVDEEIPEPLDPACEESLLYPCSKHFGRDCIVIKPERCPICFCPQYSPARGCAGPNGLSVENQVDLLRGRKLCPDGTRARTSYRYLRRVDKEANFDECYRTVQPDCGSDQDLYWKMPRFLNDCYYYCYSDAELRARGITNLTTFD